jgi:1-acyl-sn-glycerol-3-phosphate acyltransferase
MGEVQILPVAISGTRHILPKHGRLIRPQRVFVHIAAPLSAEQVRDASLNELSDRTRSVLAELSDLSLA